MLSANASFPEKGCRSARLFYCSPSGAMRLGLRHWQAVRQKHTRPHQTADRRMRRCHLPSSGLLRLYCRAHLPSRPRPLHRTVTRPARCASSSASGAGASADTAARVVAQKLGQILGQQFIVENKPGAGSNIATEFVSQAPKDGYTLLLERSPTPSTRRWPRKPASTSRDFAPVTALVVLSNVAVWCIPTPA